MLISAALIIAQIELLLSLLDTISFAQNSVRILFRALNLPRFWNWSLTDFEILWLSEILFRARLNFDIIGLRIYLGSLFGNFEARGFLFRLFDLFVGLIDFRLSVIRVLLVMVRFRFRSRLGFCI